MCKPLRLCIRFIKHATRLLGKRFKVKYKIFQIQAKYTVTETDQLVCVQTIKIDMSIFIINIHIFRHLKLEITSTIPAIMI